MVDVITIIIVEVINQVQELLVREIEVEQVMVILNQALVVEVLVLLEILLALEVVTLSVDLVEVMGQQIQYQVQV